MECGIDWENIGFEIIPGSKVLCYKFADEKWDTGNFLVGSSITLDSFATVLHYGQSCFEGLKAFRMKDGKIRLFRPKLNAERIARSCRACSLPAPPESLFLEAVQRAVQANIDYVPPFTSNGSMYVRPFVIGTEAQLGLNPAKTAQFLVIVNPVGDYYKGGMSTPARAVIKHGFDRAAPHGTGHVKLGGNYAPVLGPSLEMKKQGYTVMLFLDPKTGKYVEEFATSNFAALTAPDATGNRTYVTPKSSSVLPSVTNRSLLELSSLHFGWNVERRPVEWSEVVNGAFNEIAACGTAVVITPIGNIDRQIPIYENKSIAKKSLNQIWDDSDERPVSFDIEAVALATEFSGFKQLYDTYRGIQTGNFPDTYGWMYPSEGLC